VYGLKVFDHGLDLCGRHGSERHWNDIFSDIFNLTVLQNKQSEDDGIDMVDGTESYVGCLGYWECLRLDVLETRGDGGRGGSRTSGRGRTCEVRHECVGGAIVVVLYESEHSRLGSGRQRIV
jgi:hypothetical protein